MHVCGSEIRGQKSFQSCRPVSEASLALGRGVGLVVSSTRDRPHSGVARFQGRKVFKMQISKRCIFFQSSGKPRSTSQFFVITFRQHISAHSPRRPGSTESLDISRVFAQTGGDKKAHRPFALPLAPHVRSSTT